jgi:hypothetical protein
VQYYIKITGVADMSEIGKLVAETIEFSGSTVSTRAFTGACQAFCETAKKRYEQDQISHNLVLKFVKENWWLMKFIGLPDEEPISEEVIEESKKKLFKTGSMFQIEEIIAYLIMQNTTTKGLPIGMEFAAVHAIRVEDGKVLIPKKLISGILGVVVFHPINKDETIDETYWMSFRGFKMFISELWGREDLVARLKRLT